MVVYIVEQTSDTHFEQNHPECPDRVTAIRERLEELQLYQLLTHLKHIVPA